MVKTFLHNFYSKNDCSNLNLIFTDNCSENNCKLTNVSKEHVILDGDEIEKCFSDILNNSADRIIILEKSNNDVDIVICELSSGRRKHNLIKNKLQNTAKHIVDVFNNSKFNIKTLKCCYIGKYEKNKFIYKRKDADIIKVNGFGNIIIQNYTCGHSFDKIK